MHLEHGCEHSILRHALLTVDNTLLDAYPWCLGVCMVPIPTLPGRWVVYIWRTSCRSGYTILPGAGPKWTGENAGPRPVESIG